MNTLQTGVLKDLILCNFTQRHGKEEPQEESLGFPTL